MEPAHFEGWLLRASLPEEGVQPPFVGRTGRWRPRILFSVSLSLFFFFKKKKQHSMWIKNIFKKSLK